MLSHHQQQGLGKVARHQLWRHIVCARLMPIPRPLVTSAHPSSRGRMWIRYGRGVDGKLRTTSLPSTPRPRAATILPALTDSDFRTRHPKMGARTAQGGATEFATEPRNHLLQITLTVQTGCQQRQQPGPASSPPAHLPGRTSYQGCRKPEP